MAQSGMYCCLILFSLCQHPNAKIHHDNLLGTAFRSGDLVVVEDGRATGVTNYYITQAILSYTGDEITVVPNYYNYIFYLQGNEDEAFYTDLPATMTVKITPATSYQEV